jgi:hypothetical protein
MIKFETINGTLCRMVEPEPLQLDSPMPCVVRYIQDCSPMGRYMKRKYDMVINTVAIVSRIGTDGRAYSSDKIFIEEVEVLEIIGYPVEEGSAEWALYQMMQGKMVCHETSPWDWYRMYNDHAIQNRTVGYMDRVSAWLESTVQSGWQLYKEPKPELKYKAGDFVEIINWYSGTKHLGQIDSIDHEIHIGTHRFDISGKSVMERVPQLSIIHKLKPIVNIGCLSGTIKDLSYAEDGRFWFIGGKTERCPGGMHCILYLEMLDTPTRKLVESLLKAQEEQE